MAKTINDSANFSDFADCVVAITDMLLSMTSAVYAGISKIEIPRKSRDSKYVDNFNAAAWFTDMGIIDLSTAILSGFGLQNAMLRLKLDGSVVIKAPQSAQYTSMADSKAQSPSVAITRVQQTIGIIKSLTNIVKDSTALHGNLEKLEKDKTKLAESKTTREEL